MLNTCTSNVTTEGSSQIILLHIKQKTQRCEVFYSALEWMKRDVKAWAPHFI